MTEPREQRTSGWGDQHAREASPSCAHHAGAGEQGAADESAARVHGGVDELALCARGLSYESIADFSVNLNPYGPCAPVLEAVRLAPLDRYPDALARTARACWAEALGRQPAQVAVGHGAADLFWAIARAALSPGARAVIAEPTFSEFRFAAAAAGAQVERVFARPEHDLALNLAELRRAGQGARALYLCSPNNPTGEYVPSARVRELALDLPDTLIVLDQSFIALSEHADDARRALPDNVLAVRSLTKEFACPGLRIGLCVGAPHWVRRVEAQRPTWATSSAALAALEVCAREQAFVRTSWQKLRTDREAVRAILVAHGLSPRPSDTSYQLVPLSGEARLFCERMFEHGVQLRDCSSFGLPRHVRIAALPAAARARLHAALEAVGVADTQGGPG